MRQYDHARYVVTLVMQPEPEPKPGPGHFKRKLYGTARPPLNTSFLQDLPITWHSKLQSKHFDIVSPDKTHGMVMAEGVVNSSVDEVVVGGCLD